MHWIGNGSLFNSPWKTQVDDMRAGDSRQRRFCFTWNNYPLDAETQLRSLAQRKRITYMVVGRERGIQGTPHLQGYMHFSNPITFSALKRLLPTVHFERARGSGLDNQLYCSKEGDFFEIGELPQDASSKTKELWRDILEAAEKGNWSFIKSTQPRIWIAFRERLLSMRVPDSKVLDGDTMNEWWVGPTGSGKSRLAWEKYGDICYQKQLNKWWDGYDGQPVVVIEEWSPKNDVTASSLKIWADRYPFSAQIKGGMLQKIRPYKIIVISNYRIEDCFIDSRDAAPIARRFQVREFPAMLQTAATEADNFIATYGIKDQDVETPATEVAEDDDNEIDLDIIPEVTTPLQFQGHDWIQYASDYDFNRLLDIGRQH